MKLKIEINMDGASFSDDGNDGRNEAARILAIVARKLEQGCDEKGVTFDHNGTNVGTWAITREGAGMNPTQFTPGPWKWNTTDTCIWPAPSAQRRAQVADVFTAQQPNSELSQPSAHFSDEESANARLIAAAPELFNIIRDAIAHGGEFQLGPKGRNATLENRLREIAGERV